MLASRQLLLLVTEMVDALIDGHARITVLEEAQRVVFTVDVAERDQGRVIGKHGRTARALRTILEAASKRYGIRSELVILQKAKETTHA